MPLDEKNKQLYIKELQFLQKQINFLKNYGEVTNQKSFEKSIETLRNSQDKLYGALAYHGVTAEDVYRVIVENNDKQLVKEIMQLQNVKDKINKQLTASDLSFEKRQSLESTLAQAAQAHQDKWAEIINNPHKKTIIRGIEQDNKKKLRKETPEQTKTPDLEPEHV
ncbi:MAG: hypothetical protein LBE70_02185 [Nitrososphaerota archaeon]|jgi:membrane-associated HD superfamily phosphohydrolase|nr:hypothetical protein [Nitrososphaerota archaeon]